MSGILAELPIWAPAAVLVVAAIAIAWAGTHLAHLADALADRTGMGEVIAGALFVGGATSLPGIITSASTAAQGHAGLAIGNALGGLTVQTAFLAVADLVYRRANLEHAAASVTGLAQGALLIALLALPLMAANAPEWTLLGVHPVTPLLFIAYGLGLWLLSTVRQEPMWNPVITSDTQQEETGGKSQLDSNGQAGQGRYSQTPTRRLWLLFICQAAVTAAAGYAVGEASIALIRATTLSETAVGTVFTGVANSLPELVTAVAAVRAGAVSLAVGDIIGGNSFEVLFLAAGDVFYRNGSLYHRFESEHVFSAATAILMVAVLLLGMLRRQRHGVANIGFESALVLLFYAVSAVLVFV